MNDIYRPKSVAELKAKKRCCKSTCLHCPYGHTVKKLGIQFRKANENDRAFLDSLGCTQDIEECEIAILKEVSFAVFTKNHIQITGYWLDPEFEGQGLIKELLESYYF